MSVTRILQGALRAIIPLAPGIAIAALCLGLKENFPFTHYPMYSDFSDETYYVWLAGASGDPIASQTLTGLRLGRIKKVYNKGLLAARASIGRETGETPRKRDLTLEQKHAAAVATLDWIYQSSPEAAQATLREASPLRLYQVDITIRDDRVVESTPELVGEFAIPAKP
jgi:hypothetical protein